MPSDPETNKKTTRNIAVLAIAVLIGGAALYKFVGASPVPPQASALASASVSAEVPRTALEVTKQTSATLSPTMAVTQQPAAQMPPPDSVTTGETKQTPISGAVSKKLDSLLAEAVQKTEAALPGGTFDVRTLGIILEGKSILVDLDAAVSDDLLNHIQRLEGKVVPAPNAVPAAVRVMIPLSQLKALAAREDVKTITAGQLTGMMSGIQPIPQSEGKVSKTTPQ